jgi:hypothetical protein
LELHILKELRALYRKLQKTGALVQDRVERFKALEATGKGEMLSSDLGEIPHAYLEVIIAQNLNLSM